MNRFQSILLIILLTLAMPVLAQDTPVPAPDNSAWLAEISFAAALVTVLVSFAKRIPALQSTPSQHIALVLNVLIWVAYRFVLEFGGDASQFVQYVTNAGNMGESFMNILLTFWTAEAAYLGAKSVGVPIVGDMKVSPPKAPVQDL